MSHVFCVRQRNREAGTNRSQDAFLSTMRMLRTHTHVQDPQMSVVIRCRKYTMVDTISKQHINTLGTSTRLNTQEKCLVVGEHFVKLVQFRVSACVQYVFKCVRVSVISLAGPMNYDASSSAVPGNSNHTHTHTSTTFFPSCNTRTNTCLHLFNRRPENS